MGRALSFSLVAHALFALGFLLLSATRAPLVIPQAARPVRLVTYLEPGAAISRAARSLPAPPVAAPAPAPRTAQPPAAVAAPPVVAPRAEIPLPTRAAPPVRKEAAVPEPQPDLGQRLARRLAATGTATTRPDDAKAPQFAPLPVPLPAAASPALEAVVPGAPAAAGAIAPVGYFPHAWYLGVLKDRVYARWARPSDFFTGKAAPAALVSFRIARDGSVGSIALKESSGSARFDQAALAAVQGLGLVPALPEQYTEENLDVVIRFQSEK